MNDEQKNKTTTTDKVQPFYTPQDLDALAALDQQAAQLLKEAGNITAEMQAAKETGDKERLQELTERAREIWAGKYKDLEDARGDLLAKIEQQYIDSFAGDVPAILADVREIVAAVTKSEYLDAQKKTTESLKPSLEKKPGKDSPPEVKKNYASIKRLAVKGYENCYYFILKKIRIQLNALAYYEGANGPGSAEAIAIVKEKTGEFYEKPKNARLDKNPRGRALSLAPTAEKPGDLFALPSSPALALIVDLLSGGDPKDLPKRKSKYNRRQEITVKSKDNKREISYTTGKDFVSIQIDDVGKIIGQNPRAKKLLVRILKCASEQAIHSGFLAREVVSFPLRDLVGAGQYKNLETARQGFYNTTETLVGLKISGKSERGKKKTISQGGHAVLFTTAYVDNATCMVALNKHLNWQFITQYYTALPNFYFELSPRAADLLEHIFNMARQNTKLILQGDPFVISYRAIQYKLNLPDETTNRNPQRDIKDAIENAIEEIEEACRKYTTPTKDGKGTAPELALLPQADYFAPVKKYLDDGRLEVTLRGSFAERFIKIGARTLASADERKAKAERIQEAAQAINIAKTLNKKSE